jgi:UDP-N-acetylmuramoylalanine-D-glutamate ligase
MLTDRTRNMLLNLLLLPHADEYGTNNDYMDSKRRIYSDSESVFILDIA